MLHPRVRAGETHDSESETPRDVRGTIAEIDADGTIARIEGHFTVSAPGRKIPDVPFTIESAPEE